jgi:O-antigen/teichoic acid export membrane protein
VMFRAALIITMATLSLAAYIILIPRMGWRGAAIGTDAGELLTVVVAWAALIVFQNRHDREVHGDVQPADALATS